MPIVSKSELFKRLRADNFDPSDDHLEVLRPDVLSPFVTVAGCGNQRFATEDQANRIKLYYHLRRRLGTKKLRRTEVAFWFAAAGFDVPAGLVAEHIEFCVNSFTGMLHRMVERRGSGSIPLQHATAPQAQRLGDLMAKAVLKVFPPQTHGMLRSVIGSVLELALRAMWVGDRFERVSVVINRILEAIGIPEPSRWARPFWEAATECASLFVKGDRNGLVVATREAYKENPTFATRAASDALLVAWVASRVFPWMMDASSAASDFIGITQSDVTAVNRFLIPMFAAVLLFLRDREYTQQSLRELRAGDCRKLADLATIRQLIPTIQERLGAA